jgi:hypothetical protein
MDWRKDARMRCQAWRMSALSGLGVCARRRRARSGELVQRAAAAANRGRGKTNEVGVSTREPQVQPAIEQMAEQLPALIAAPFALAVEVVDGGRVHENHPGSPDCI